MSVGQEFSAGPGLPAGWSSSTWESSGGGAGGTATVSAGSLHVDGALAGTDATFSPGHALEFVATFGATAFQHAGFGVDVNTSPNWAMFSTNNTADQLFARTNVGGTAAVYSTAARVGAARFNASARSSNVVIRPFMS